MNKIRTDSIDYAAFLMLQGIPWIAVEPQNTRLVDFVFEAKSDEQVWVLNTIWCKGSVLLPAKPYAAAINRVKALIRNVSSLQEM